MKSQSNYSVNLKFKNLEVGKIKATSSFSFKAESGLKKKDINANLMKYYRSKVKEITDNIDTEGVDNWEVSADPFWAKVVKEIQNLRNPNKVLIEEVEEEKLGDPKEQKKAKLNKQEQIKQVMETIRKKNKDLNFPLTLTAKICHFSVEFSDQDKPSAYMRLDLDKAIPYEYSLVDSQTPRVYERSTSLITVNDYKKLKSLHIDETKIGKKVTITINAKKIKGETILEVMKFKF
jgi:hypothetical protein